MPKNIIRHLPLKDNLLFLSRSLPSTKNSRGPKARGCFAFLMPAQRVISASPNQNF